MLAAIMVIITGCYLFDEWYRYNKHLELLRMEHISVVTKFYENIPKRTTAILKAYANLIDNDHHVTDAYAAGDRDALNKQLKPYVVLLEKSFPGSTVVLTFHTAEGRVFLRTLMPEVYGDKSTDYRPMLRTVLKTGKPLSGLEVCTKVVGQRFMVPIKRDGKIIGVIEVGADLNFIANRIAGISNIKSVITVNRDVARLLGMKTGSDGRTMYFNNSKASMNTVFSGDSLKQSADTPDGRYEIIKGFTLYDYSGKNIGNFIFLTKAGGMQEWMQSHFINVLIICAAGLLLIIYVARKGFIESIAELETEHEKVLKELKQINAGLEERVRKEVENCRMKDQIINQQQKVADMGLMLSALAHHWRQPINAVGLYVQDLSDAYKSGELNIQYIEEFEKKNMSLLNKLSESIDKYRTFFEPSVEKESFEIIKILREIGDILSATLSTQNIKLLVSCKCPQKEFDCVFLERMPECEYGNTRITGFLNEFKQTLLNIIYNSVDAIRARYAEENGVCDGLITVTISVDGDIIRITVTDNGTGIPDDVIDKIFNPFFTTKEAGKGTGIGLYMAKTVIEKYMCGTITAKNNGQGVTMEIVLNKNTPCV
jgi:signal transduction histidine kinase